MKGTKLFIYSAGAVLLAATLERLLIATGSAQALALPEPVMGIPLRYAVLLVGGFELVVALICLFGKQTGLQLGWLAWMATNYAVYRIGLLTMGIHQQGTCIGTLTDPLHLERGTFGNIIGVLPLYLLVGSYVGVFWLWLAGCRAKAAKFIKMSCPACGVHLRFDDRNLGQKILCPQCQKSITLRKPDLLKIVCFFCQEHIEFPSHAIGEKMPCPHCNMDITLKERHEQISPKTYSELVGTRARSQMVGLDFGEEMWRLSAHLAPALPPASGQKHQDLAGRAASKTRH